MVGLTVDLGSSVLMEQARGITIDERWIDDLLRRCQKYGVDTVLWRVTMAGLVAHHSNIMERVQEYHGERSSALAALLRNFDPLRVAVAAARRCEVRLLAFITIADYYCIRPVVDLEQSFIDTLKKLSLTLRQDGQPVAISVDPFFSARADYCWTSRDGRYHHKGVPSLAFPEVKARLLDHVREIVEYDADGIYLCTRTHSKDPGWYGYAAEECDAFGYEEPIRAEYRKRYGVDIRHEDFDRDAWQRLKGEYLTDFLRAVKEAVGSHGQSLLFGIKPDRFSYLWAGTGMRSDFARLYKDWESWSQEEILDSLVLITDRTVIDELDFVGEFLESVTPGCAVCPWLNLNGPPLRSAGEIRRMGQAAFDVGAPGVVYHEADDLRAVESGGGFDDKLWGALTMHL